ncbi:MAG: hypothetical protein ACR2PQ_00780, partial [Myxococcota bacterium]
TYVDPFAGSVSAMSPNGRRAAGSGFFFPGGLYGEVFRHNVNTGALAWLGFVGTPHDIDNGWRMVGSTGAYPATGEAFLWTPAGGLNLLGDLPGGLDESEARAIGANGQIVAGYGSSTIGREAVVWTASGMERLADKLSTTYGFTLPAGVRLLEVSAMTADAKTLVGTASDGGVPVGFLLELP